jgi:hypothetical protein
MRALYTSTPAEKIAFLRFIEQRLDVFFERGCRF